MSLQSYARSAEALAEAEARRGGDGRAAAALARFLEAHGAVSAATLRSAARAATARGGAVADGDAVAAADAAAELRALIAILTPAGASARTRGRAEALARWLEALGERDLAAIAAALSAVGVGLDGGADPSPGGSRGEAYAARLRAADPDRAAMEAVLAEASAEGAAMGAAEWKALARLLAGETARSKAHAEEIVRAWIGFAARMGEAGAQIEEAHRSGF